MAKVHDQDSDVYYPGFDTTLQDLPDDEVDSDEEDFDDEDAPTPQGVVDILGFDPDKYKKS